MKPLVTTVNVLHELATGISHNAIDSSPVLYQFDAGQAEFLLHADDGADAQRIVLIRENNVQELDLPDELSNARRRVLSRMASFAQRAQSSKPLSLPRGWHQYKHHNLVAFFAVPGGDASSTRWIAEVLPNERTDIVFWTTTTSDSKAALDEFDRSIAEVLPRLDLDWARAVQVATDHFTESRRPPSGDVEMYLPAIAQSQTKGWSFEKWLEMVSNDQKEFIEAPTDRSIRLRGPAGSGKTLSLTLKAIREVLRARESGDKIRVLMATHSWALAAQISDSLDAMGYGIIDEIQICPLLELPTEISPAYSSDTAGVTVIGEDSFSGKQAQLDEILEVLDDFIRGDWITYRARTTHAFRYRFDSENEDDRKALAWDLLVEFGSVIGAAAIFPGAGSETRYFQLHRAPWMLPLESREDLRVVYTLYCRYMESLEARSLVSSDQVLADFLSYLETHSWNRSRKTKGYDLVFVDEFHLFSPLERQVLHYLTNDVASYPRIFMAVDPRQSPSEAFIGVAADETRSHTSIAADDTLGDVANFELNTVHRFTPQILELVKHIHHEFPTFNLGHDWDIDFSMVESAQDDGPLPYLISCASRRSEEIDIYQAVKELYPHGRVALAVVDRRQWGRFSKLASDIGKSEKFHVTSIVGRSDIEGLGYRRKGLVVGQAEYLAGLQFDAVLVAGISDLQAWTMGTNEKNRLLSLLYLAISRAQREVRVFVNEDDGGLADVLQHAVANGLMTQQRGALA